MGFLCLGATSKRRPVLKGRHPRSRRASRNSSKHFCQSVIQGNLPFHTRRVSLREALFVVSQLAFQPQPCRVFGTSPISPRRFQAAAGWTSVAEAENVNREAVGGELDCYWVGSLDFNLLEIKETVPLNPPKKVELFAGERGQQQPSEGLVGFARPLFILHSQSSRTLCFLGLDHFGGK